MPVMEPSDVDLLLELLTIPTAGPLETTDPPAELWRAQRRYAVAAAPLGLAVVHHAPAAPNSVRRTGVPAAVREAARDPEFLTCQPNLVLRAGPADQAATVMFNVHLDTVAGTEPVDFDGRSFTGRGAIDAKGPAVALLAGIRAAMAEDPSIGREVGVLVQAVSGEEGGAMGTIGTRPLVEAGHVGRLNVFCEPTGSRYLPRATAAMTACVRVRGRDAIDDRPAAGHNATVLLGYLAARLGATLPGAVEHTQVCVAGLHTGHRHNRVYGAGTLLLNMSYLDTAAADRLAAVTEREVRAALAEFAGEFRDLRDFHRTAVDAAEITALDWPKRGLPALSVVDPWGESLMRRAGVEPWPVTEPAFTCDAIWMDGVPGAYTVVLGPGSLAANNAHARGEYADLAELDVFAGTVADLLLRFAGDRKATT